MNAPTPRVLIAAHDNRSREALKRCLSTASCELVAEAANGEEAVRQVIDCRPDVVFMESRMPKMDGLQATAIIQQQCPTPVIILGADETEPALDQAGEAGVAAYLSQPAEAAEIQRAITIALARQRDLLTIRKLTAELQSSLDEIKALRAILSTCSDCQKIPNQVPASTCFATPGIPTPHQ